jgi:ankyrin repeat protein
MKKLFLIPLLFLLIGCGSSADQELVQAVKNKEKGKIEELLKAGADPNADGSGLMGEGTTAMFEAAYTGDVEIFEMLVEAGGDPSFEMEFGTMIVRIFNGLSQQIGHEIAFCNLSDQELDDYITIVDRCVELGAEIGAFGATDDLDMDMHLETQYDRKNSIINIAANSSIGIDDIDDCLPQMEKMIKVFLGHGCDIDHADNWRNTALIYHVKRRNMNMIKLIVELGADIDKTGGDREASPMWYALWTEIMYSDNEESEYHLLFENDNEVTDYFRSKGAKEYCETCN